MKKFPLALYIFFSPPTNQTKRFPLLRNLACFSFFIRSTVTLSFFPSGQVFSSFFMSVQRNRFFLLLFALILVLIIFCFVLVIILEETQSDEKYV